MFSDKDNQVNTAGQLSEQRLPQSCEASLISWQQSREELPEVNSIVMVISRSVSKERENGDMRRSRSGEGRPASRSRSRSRNRSHSPRGRRSYSPRRSRSRSRGRRFSRSRSRSRSRSNDDGYRLHIGGNFQKNENSNASMTTPVSCVIAIVFSGDHNYNENAELHLTFTALYTKYLCKIIWF